MDLENNICNFAAVAASVPVDQVTLQSNVHTDLNCKSLTLVALTAQIEDEYDVTIPFDEANKLQTVQDFVDRVKSEL